MTTNVLDHNMPRVYTIGIYNTRLEDKYRTPHNTHDIVGASKEKIRIRPVARYSRYGEEEFLVSTRVLVVKRGENPLCKLQHGLRKNANSFLHAKQSSAFASFLLTLRIYFLASLILALVCVLCS